MKTSAFTTLVCLALLSGCATLNERECRSADWYLLGIKDGQQGEPANLLGEHQESCARYGIHPDGNRYLAGREAGLTQYCQPGNAFRTGMNGEEYKGVCPLNADAAFRRNNAAALEVYNSKKKIEEVDRQLSGKEHELTKKDTPEKEKVRLREAIRDLDRKRDRLRSDLRYQERELDRLMDEARYRGERR